MYFVEIFTFVLVISYARVYAVSSFEGVARGGFGGRAGGYGCFADISKSMPYSFGYDAPSDHGRKHFRKETGDGHGCVVGSYGYTDKQGLYRVVDYTAKAVGFHANLKTNEPGTNVKGNPADVSFSL